MSRAERNSAWPPSWVIPTSKLTRVRVELFSKIIARLRPASAARKRWGSRLSSAVRPKIASTSSAPRSWIERKWRAGMNLPGGARLERVPFERHGHAARAAARPRQLAAREGDGGGAAAEVGRRERLLLGEHAPAARGEPVGRVAVLVVEEDDPGRHGEGVRAVGPLLPLLVEEVAAAAAGHDLDLHAESGEGAAKRGLHRERQLTPRSEEH